MSWFELVRQVLYVVGGVGSMVFPVYYHHTTKGAWRHYDMGVFLMLSGLGWMSLYLSGILAIVFPSEVARDVIRLVLIVGAGSFAWYQVFLYRKVRREELARKRKEGTR